MRVGCCLAVLCSLWAVPPARAQRVIQADDYLDRLRGMWLGQIVGNYAGRDTEGDFRIPGGNPAEEVAFVFADPWVGDDDTCFEYMYLDLLGAGPAPSNGDIKQSWETHVPLPSFYIANRQARWLMADGLAPPDTGSIHKNMHYWAIDSQIDTEALGAAAPGMRQRAADLVGQFGSTTNDGFAVHAAQFYAAMYAAAATESDVEALVARGLEVVPTTSRTHRIIQDVRTWHAEDLADGSPDWRATHVKIYDKYVGADSFGRYRGWVESSVNTALTTMAILYGGGDFKETVRIGVLGGFDCDCNPATAGGLIGLIDGYSGLPAEVTSGASDAYHVTTLQNIVTDTTIQAVAQGWQAAAEAQILQAGGTITGTGAARTYHLPADDPVAPPPERPDRTRPRGLVEAVQALGGRVTPSTSIEPHDPTHDRHNRDGIVDGVVDVSYNGRLPYWTYDGANEQPAGGDFYQLDFGRDLVFDRLIFWEGDIGYNGVNNNPKEHEPKGGYFLDLTVEVGDDGQWQAVDNLQLSEALDPFEYHQRIVLTFDPAAGDAVRIRGDAGGTCQFTSILELEAFGTIPGLVPGDANLDGLVDVLDLAALANHFGSADAGLRQGDANMDGVVDALDLALLANHFGESADGTPAPEPAGAALLVLPGMLLLRRGRRKRTRAQGTSTPASSATIRSALSPAP